MPSDKTCCVPGCLEMSNGAEMVAYYHKQWSLMRKKLHHQSLQLRRLRKRVETLEGRSREGAGKT
ncbi:unnamed protein product, partial [Iphiclides podalirius]